MTIIVSAGKTRSQDRPVGLKPGGMRSAEDGHAWESYAEGGLNCGRCTVTWYIPRLILVFGDLLPLFLVIPLKGGFVARYNSSLFPEKDVVA
ncbi:PREDICTED: transmembrane protein 126A-like [Lipotes vexillifer]|uniref:Transmembrane protein 126A-like n=1 Tax=Lipotes vexillifer TaxID=118797 RepID=A0A340WHK9_LIPVE|nr:PREDICTED: transmembrane protein 126A-like [Lipotes vexillifer]